MVSTTDAHKAVRILTKEARDEEVSDEERDFLDRYLAKRERKSPSNGNGGGQ
jgi:hypothetical protein